MDLVNKFKTIACPIVIKLVDFSHNLYLWCNKCLIIMNIRFTKKQERYIESQIESGDFKSANEVVRAALKLHEAYRHRVIEELRAEIEKGWSGETSERKAADIIREKLQFIEHKS